MANKRQKKKALKKAAMQPQTYRGGRGKGRKNLIRTDSGYRNQYGVEFTDADRRALVREVNKANYKRKKMLKEAAELPRKIGGVDTGDKVGTLQLMGKESDFILTPKTKSLQRFKSREDFDRYLSNMVRVNDPNYIPNRIRLYKRNFMKSLTEVYGDEAKDIVMKVRMMKPEDYMRLVESDETLEISYVPSDMKIAGRLNELRAALGMKLKDEWDDEEEYY